MITFLIFLAITILRLIAGIFCIILVIAGIALAIYLGASGADPSGTWFDFFGDKK